MKTFVSTNFKNPSSTAHDGLAKAFYYAMLKQIVEAERQDLVPQLPKGQACINWGIAEFLEGDIDGGIARMLWAYYEDSRSAGRQPIPAGVTKTFDRDLYIQFSEGRPWNGRSQFGNDSPMRLVDHAIQQYNAVPLSQKLNANIRNPKDIVRADIFSEIGLNASHRSILEGSLWTIARNIAIFEDEDRYNICSGSDHNVFTRLRLFDGIVNLYRFVELRMRDRENVSNLLQRYNQLYNRNYHYLTMGSMIDVIFHNESWKSAYDREQSVADSAQVFDTNLAKGRQNLTFPAKNIFCLIATRNYATHISDPHVPHFFQNIRDILTEILCSYFFYSQFKGLM